MTATITHLRRSLDAATNGGSAIVAINGLHPLPVTAAFLALALRLHGDADEADAMAAHAAVLSAEVGNRVSEAMNEIFAAMDAVARLDPRAALAHATAYSALAADLGMSMLEHQADLASGWALGVSGDVDGGMARIERCRLGLAALSDHPLVVSPAFVGADVALHAGRAELARDLADRALAARQLSGEALFLPELLRVRGLALEALGERAGAIESVADAVEVGRSQSAHLFVERSARVLERLQDGRSSSDVPA